MSLEMDEEIKRWTAKRKSALVMEIIQGKKTVAEASRQFDLPPSEVEDWIDQARAGMENALRAKPEDVRQGLLADGYRVSVSKLCNWFDIPRRTVYYRPVKAAPKVNPVLEAPIKAMIEQEPSFGYRTVAS